MKSIFKTMAFVAMSIALAGVVACGEKENTTPEPQPEPVPPTQESSTFAFHYQGRTLEAGQTVYFYPSADEAENDWATVHFMMENKTEANVGTYMKVELAEGPEALNNLTICFGETCKTGTCPWTSDVISLTPGINQNLEVALDYVPSQVTSKSVYRITIGKGPSLEDPQVMFVDMAALPQE